MEREILKAEFLKDPDRFVDLFIALIQKVDQLVHRVEVLEKENKELKARLNKNSTNSSKPPSSDAYQKKSKNNNSRKKSGKSSGGQKGHAGTTLQMSSDPDTIIEHYPDKCTNCGKFNTCKEQFDFYKRQVFDIERPLLNITEHRIFFGTCCGSGREVNGCFPDNIKSPVSCIF